MPTSAKPASSMSRQVEAELIGRVARGDEEAFHVLYRNHAPSLYRVSLRLCAGREADAHDVLQEGWLRALRGLDRFEGRSSLRTWLQAIVVRCALESNRVRKRTAASLDSVRETGEPPVRSSARIDLERAFEQLSEGFRSVLVLHDLLGYTHAEIAEFLGVREGTSKSQLFRARRRMRVLLGKGYTDESTMENDEGDVHVG